MILHQIAQYWLYLYIDTVKNPHTPVRCFPP